jgi:hypothetical protein
MRPACRWNSAAPRAASSSAMRLLITDLERFERAAAPDTVPVSMTSRNVLISSIVHRMPSPYRIPRVRTFLNRSQIANAGSVTWALNGFRPNSHIGAEQRNKQELPTCN